MQVNICGSANTGTSLCRSSYEYITSSLLLQQCSACLSRVTWMICEIGGKWPLICYFVGSCLQESFKIGRSIFVLFPSSFSLCFVSVHGVHLYNSIDTATAKKNPVSFHRMIDNLLITFNAYVDSRWDIATEVCELVNKLYGLTTENEDDTFLF